MKRLLRRVPKNGEGFTPLKLEHILIFLFGVCLVVFGNDLYHRFNSVAQVVVLIVYLGLLVGIAPLPMPVFKSKFLQTFFAGLLSGLLDSYIVLVQCKRLRTVEGDQDRESVMMLTNNQEAEGVRAKLLALFMIAALVGGLVIWFGEVYAAGLYINDHRTDFRSALYILPPVLVFLSILGIHASLLPIEVVPNLSQKVKVRDLIEFGVGIWLLFWCHNPLLCLGWLLVYAVVSRQDDCLLDVWKFHTEVNVMLVLLIALVAGPWLVASVVVPLGLDQGAYLPIIPAGIQAVLWGPLYEDSSVYFWMRITTLSTGALIMPISSLVGVMLFKTMRQWWMYMKYSIPYAVVWYVIMRAWIFLTLETPVGHMLEQWAHAGGSH